MKGKGKYGKQQDTRKTEVASDEHLRIPFKGHVEAVQAPPVKCVRVEGFPGHIAHRDPNNWGVDRKEALRAQ